MYYQVIHVFSIPMYDNIFLNQKLKWDTQF